MKEILIEAPPGSASSEEFFNDPEIQGIYNAAIGRALKGNPFYDNTKISYPHQPKPVRAGPVKSVKIPPAVEQKPYALRSPSVITPKLEDLPAAEIHPIDDNKTRSFSGRGLSTPKAEFFPIDEPKEPPPFYVSDVSRRKIKSQDDMAPDVSQYLQTKGKGAYKVVDAKKSMRSVPPPMLRGTLPFKDEGAEKEQHDLGLQYTPTAPITSPEPTAFYNPALAAVATERKKALDFAASEKKRMTDVNYRVRPEEHRWEDYFEKKAQYYAQPNLSPGQTLNQPPRSPAMTDVVRQFDIQRPLSGQKSSRHWAALGPSKPIVPVEQPDNLDDAVPTHSPNPFESKGRRHQKEWQAAVDYLSNPDERISKLNTSVTLDPKYELTTLLSKGMRHSDYYDRTSRNMKMANQLSALHSYVKDSLIKTLATTGDAHKTNNAKVSIEYLGNLINRVHDDAHALKSWHMSGFKSERPLPALTRREVKTHLGNVATELELHHPDTAKIVRAHMDTM